MFSNKYDRKAEEPAGWREVNFGNSFSGRDVKNLCVPQASIVLAWASLGDGRVGIFFGLIHDNSLFYSDIVATRTASVRMLKPPERTLEEFSFHIRDCRDKLVGFSPSLAIISAKNTRLEITSHFQSENKCRQDGYLSEKMEDDESNCLLKMISFSTQDSWWWVLFCSKLIIIITIFFFFFLKWIFICHFMWKPLPKLSFW